ncbi:MAG: hypothetical protein AMJ60_00380 [Desulfobacterales bacterium SG8_35]|nr:MAG: hypothetical protein AMJ60_00380 [Desulfobacterales bacterium SG8_35]
MKEKPEIPLHTKWGIRVTAVIILLISIMIIKNCMGSFRYGVSTKQELQKQYYELGYSHGVEKAQGVEQAQEPETENLLLRKLYRKGYRDGWDSAQSGKEAKDPDGQPKAGQ